MYSQKTCIRDATAADLPELHRIASDALPLDRFSSELLEEKLFANRRPDQFQWRVQAATIDGRIVGFMQSVVRPSADKAWIGIFAVREPHRRNGIAARLFEHVRSSWPAGIGECEVLAIPCNYFHPGLDPRYTEALCFVERLGFRRGKDCANLTGSLARRFDTAVEHARLSGQGVSVRRATLDDQSLLDAFFAANFGEDWRYEAGLALAQTPVALHVAIKDGKIIAFSGHSSQNREWGFFGPMGTAPESRGLGLGRVLLWHCLNDMYDAGHRTCVIPWVGPISFYHQWAGCRVDRVFWRYVLKL